jgi:hypothetical protein
MMAVIEARWRYDTKLPVCDEGNDSTDSGPFNHFYGDRAE